MKNGLGAVEDAAEETSEFSLIPNETLMTMYENLLKSRLVEVRQGRTRKRDEGEWAAVKSACVGVTTGLRAEDRVHSAEEIAVLPLLGTGAGRDEGRDGVESLHRALGAAMLNKSAEDAAVAVVFWRDAEHDCWPKALEAARANRLPMLFVAPAPNGNGKAGRAARKNGKAAEAELEAGEELPRILVDGYDAVAVDRVAHESSERARRGRGPTVVECASLGANGRGNAEAVAKMERYLHGKGLLRRGLKQEMMERVEKELRGAKRKAK